ncbi:MAG TPA: protein kinase [Candidatus Acidoferrales bacterium]|nr:protein kinase [Candidatus Acidoferrales bacterium]
MSLSTGTKLGPYEIVAPLGAGGMGEVYRARDTRLGRDVALKVLPASFAQDQQRLRRFEQEARAASALNHPNILAIYDIGTHAGAPFLVAELLEGETLREPLRSGPLPVRKALEVAVQTAHGLAAAHEKGIVHRDLKPENIFLTRDGRVKILDFGLAKLTRPEAEGETRSQAATVATDSGVVVGTAGYMSPEQVRALPTDHRSDIFSFGAILYEMLSGRRAFHRESSVETMSAILKEEPPEISSVSRSISPALERVVVHCLEKKAEARFQSASDLAFALEALSGVSGTRAAESGAAFPAAVSARKRRLIFAAAGTLGLLIVGIGAFILGRGGAAMTQPTYHQLTFDRGLIYSARFAADGQSVYYSASWKGQPIQVYSTNPSSPESRPLNLNNASLFATSPSERAISIGCKDLLIGACEGTLATVPISGGAPRAIEDDVVSADWTPDGRQFAAVREVSGAYQVEFPLGTVIYKSESWMNHLRISPRGDAVAFAQYGSGAADAGWAVILDRNGKQIARSSVEFASVEGLAWSHAGNEVWFGATATHDWANAIHSVDSSGKERIVLRLPGMLRLHDISRDGRILLSKEVWRTGMQCRGPKDAAERDVSWLDGTVLTDLSSDGQTMAFDEYGEAAGTAPVAYIRKTDGSPAVKLGPGYLPTFSPDGKWVLVTVIRPPRLLLLPTGAGEARDMGSQGMQEFAQLGWMPDGKKIYFAGNDGHNWRMYVEDLEDEKPLAFSPPILVNPQQHQSELVSPDGKYCLGRDPSGRGWLYPLAGGEPRTVMGLSPEDTWLNWSADGRSGFVYEDEKTHAQVFRLDLSTGKRQIVTTLAPGDPAGLVDILPVRLSPDGRSYAYSYNRSLSDLYLVEGVK